MIPCWNRLEKYLNYLLVFLLPTQLALHFWPPSAFVFGIRVDYLAPSIYLTDVLFLMLFIVWVRVNTKSFLEFFRENKIYILLFISLAVLNVAFSTSVFPSVYKWIKLTELVMFYYYVRERHDIFNSKALFSTLFYSLIFFSVIGISQFIFGKTVGGPLYLLGERSFNVSTPGIALVAILGRNFMRAYSTFSHPNSFAGYLGLGLLATFFAYSKKELIKKSLGILIICVALVLTFSLSAFIGISLCGVLFLLMRKKILKTNHMIFIPSAFLLVSLALPFVSKIVLNYKINIPQNLSQRAYLTAVSGKIISQNFLLGTGLNTFVINESRVKILDTYLWILQPVHNIFLLVFSETGVLGLLLLYCLMIMSTKRAVSSNNKLFYFVLVFVLVTGLADHYWLTLQQNMFILAFILANFFGEQSKNYGTLFQMNEEGIIIHTDGGARGNPGPAACAFVAEVNGKIIQKESKFLGNTTNNYAEYQGVILAYKWLTSNKQDLVLNNLTFYLDSELVVRQLNGLYKVKDKTLIGLFQQVSDLSKSVNINIFYKHIPRTKNKIADFLVNEELDKQSLAS